VFPRAESLPQGVRCIVRDPATQRSPTSVPHLLRGAGDKE
jgi:hypothetical protein